jgi:GNAT superfamily N-acetyltransferase
VKVQQIESTGIDYPWVEDVELAFDCRLLANHGPDQHWVVTENNEKVVGRCSLWWNDFPPHFGHKVGVIGHYGAANQLAAHKLLGHACRQLKDNDCTLSVGPMDGNTWRSYRLVSERGSRPRFFMEPDNPDDWPRHFLDSGFSEIVRYTSTLNTNLSYDDPRLPRAVSHVGGKGIRVRTVDPERFEDELRRVYYVTVRSFQKNPFFTELDIAIFLDEYGKLRPYIQEKLAFIAERDEEPIGYLFAVPDNLQAENGRAVDTVIIKTVAVLPGRANAGLGIMLVARVYENARMLGYSKAIHALMREGSTSHNISSRYTRPFRRYALYAKRIA